MGRTVIRKQTSCFRSPIGKEDGETIRERERRKERVFIDRGKKKTEKELELERRGDRGVRQSSSVGEFGDARETALSAFA